MSTVVRFELDDTVCEAAHLVELVPPAAVEVAWSEQVLLRLRCELDVEDTVELAARVVVEELSVGRGRHLSVNTQLHYAQLRNDAYHRLSKEIHTREEITAGSYVA